MDLTTCICLSPCFNNPWVPTATCAGCETRMPIHVNPARCDPKWLDVNSRRQERHFAPMHQHLYMQRSICVNHNLLFTVDLLIMSAHNHQHISLSWRPSILLRLHNDQVVCIFFTCCLTASPNFFTLHVQQLLNDFLACYIMFMFAVCFIYVYTPVTRICSSA